MTAAAAEPAAESLRGHYAGLVSRSIAFLIDIAIVAVAGSVTAWMISGLVSILGWHVSADDAAPRAAVIIMLPIMFTLYCAIGFTLLGKTVGKALMGLRVVRLDGTTPKFFRSLVRALAYFLSAILMLGFIWIGIDRRRRGWHDKIARTFVVYDWQAKGASILELRRSEVLVPHDE